MTKPMTEDECGIGPFWRVRVVVPNHVIHLASRTEPAIRMVEGHVAGVEMALIEGTEHGDTVGFIDWSVVTALTWRKAPTKEPATKQPPVIRPARGRRRRELQ